MKWNDVRVVFFKELREILRDRRSLIIMFGVPAVLYPALAIGIGSIAKSQQDKYVGEKNKIVVVNGADAPHLMEMLQDKKSTLEAVDSPDAQAALRKQSIEAILTVSPAAEKNAVAGTDVKIEVELDRSRRATGFVEQKIDRLLDKYQRWVVEQRLAGRGVPKDVLHPFEIHTADIATGEQRMGNLLGQVLPMLLLVTGMLGAFFPALNVTTAEREHGTLETLLVSPVGRAELLTAKGLLVLIGGLLTAGLNLVSMSLVFWRLYSMIPKLGESLSLSPKALALTYLATVPTLIFFSGIVLVVGLLARTYREASSMATPVMLLPIASMVIGLADPKLSTGLLVTPVANTTLIIREVLVGRATAGDFIIAFAASCVYAGLLVSVAARVFGNEQLVNSGWEPLTLKGLGKRTGKKRRLPGVDEVIALWAATVLLVFYVPPSLDRGKLLILIAVVEIGLIALPTMIAGWWGRWKWAQTLSWRKAGAGEMIGAMLVGIGIIPWATFLASLQDRLWPAGADYFRQTTEILANGVAAHPIWTVVIVGVLAGVCEELLYRGPIQSALMRKLPPGWAILIGAAMFSAAHVDAHGFPIRLLLGIVLGYVVYRGKSIFPAMLLHGVFDAAQVAFLSWQVHAYGVDEVIRQTGQPEPINSTILLMLGTGAVFAVIGWMILRNAWSKKSLTPEAGQIH